MKRGQVFVRAYCVIAERWVDADVFDLTQESFNSFVMDRMFKHAMVTGLKDEFAEGEEVRLEVHPHLEGEYIHTLEDIE